MKRDFAINHQYRRTMVIIAAFVVLVFLYSLVSKRLEHTVITAPIIFTAAGVLLIPAISGLGV